MNANGSFRKFNSEIRLADSKRIKLKGNRFALRGKVKLYFKDMGWQIPSFYSQGSFPLKTNLNPIRKEDPDGSIKQKYDLDDGVYFICPSRKRETASTYHNRVKASVAGHASGIKDKNACVRVEYADGHHIDLPIYWMEREDDVPQLAHKSKNYINSDPKAFKEWVDGKISDSKYTGQLRRIIRFLKAWKDYCESRNPSIRLPSGFVFTILACSHYESNERDDLALRNTVRKIKAALDYSYTCYPPTTPNGEDLLGRYNRNICLSELEKFLNDAASAIDSSSKGQTSECWRRIFGNRFPLDKDDDRKKPIIATVPPRPWGR